MKSKRIPVWRKNQRLHLLSELDSKTFAEIEAEDKDPKQKRPRGFPQGRPTKR